MKNCSPGSVLIYEETSDDQSVPTQSEGSRDAFTFGSDRIDTSSPGIHTYQEFWILSAMSLR